MSYILSIDEGTTGITVMLVDEKMNLKAKVSADFDCAFPKPGWVEQNPVQIWQLTQKLIGQLLQKAKIKGTQIAAIGITNQRETCVLWDKKTGEPFYPAIVWQDRRTSGVCEKLKQKNGLESWVQKKTGLVLDPYFSATKIAWILEHSAKAKSAAKKGQLAFGTIDTWILHHLTGQKVLATDVTNASRTLLMNLHSLAWDNELLKLFKIPSSILPTILDSSQIFGYTKGVLGLPDGIPISGIAGDQQAALFGQVCFSAGEAKCTYGTGSFLLMNVGAKPQFSNQGLITTVAWKIKNQLAYALEGSSFVAGSAVQWLRDGLKLIQKSSQIETLAASVKDSGGVTFVPALAGLGAPYWEPEARGVLSGLTRGTTAAHVAKAVLEGLAFSQYDILMAMQKDSGKKLKSLKVDGGASQNNALMQFQSDILGCHILRPKMVETTALGAALLAGLGVGFWKDLKTIQQHFKIDRNFKPNLKPALKQEILHNWQKAIERAKIV